MKAVRSFMMLVIAGVFVVAGFVSCSGVTVDTGGIADVGYTIGAIKLGGEFAKRYPQEVPVAKEFCNKFILSESVSVPMWKLAKEYLASKFSDDPVNKACLDEVLNSIVMPDTNLPGTVGLDRTKFVAVAKGFLAGINAATP